MTPLPISPRDALALGRHARTSDAARGPLLVSGTLADQLARELGAGAAPGAVRTSGDPKLAAALIHVIGGEPTPSDVDVLRTATRALLPIVVVRLDDSSGSLPYVLATDVVTCQPGKGFPIDEIAKTLARTLGKDGAGLARAIPRIRDAYVEQRAEESALSAAALAASGTDKPKLPLLAIAQARALTDIETARGDVRREGPAGAASTVGLPLGAAVGTGLLARTLVRRLPRRGRAIEALVAGATTYALATAFRRLRKR